MNDGRNKPRTWETNECVRVHFYPNYQETHLNYTWNKRKTRKQLTAETQTHHSARSVRDKHLFWPTWGISSSYPNLNTEVRMFSQLHKIWLLPIFFRTPSALINMKYIYPWKITITFWSTTTAKSGRSIGWDSKKLAERVAETRFLHFNVRILHP